MMNLVLFSTFLWQFLAIDIIFVFFFKYFIIQYNICFLYPPISSKQCKIPLLPSPKSHY